MMLEALKFAHNFKISDLPTHKLSFIHKSLEAPSVDIDTVPFLYGLITALRPKRAVEVGLAFGTSAITLATAAEDTLKEFHVIDPYQTKLFESKGVALLREALFSSNCDFQFYEKKAQIVLPLLLEGNKPFDYAMIDGSHRFDDTLVEVYYILQMLEVGGILIMDDRIYPMVSGVLAFMESNYKHCTIDRSHTRLTVIEKTGQDRRRWFDYWHFSPPKRPDIEAKFDEYGRKA